MNRLWPCLLLVLSLPVSAAGAAPSYVGTWFGTSQPYDKGAMYIDHMLANGEIHSQFRTCRNGKPLDDTEDGFWSEAGGTMTIRVAAHDGLPAPRIDVYRIVSFSGDRFSEIYLRLNYPYQPRRVDMGFKMPSCEFVS